MAEPTGTIEPINSFDQSFMDRIYNYINQPLNTEDPIQNLVSGVAEFIPGISTELAKRRGDKFGEALSYLDYLGAGGAKLALSPFLIARRKEIQQTLKTFDEDPILKGNETVRDSLKKELDQINKTEAEELRIAKQYDEFVKDPTKFGKSQPTKEIADSTKKTGRNEPVPKNMLRDMQADYIKSRGGPTEIPPVLYDRRSIDDEILDFDKAVLRGDYKRTPNNPDLLELTNKNMTTTSRNVTGYGKYLDNPNKLKELKLATGPDLRYSTQQDPTLLQDAFSGQYPELNRLFHGSQKKGIKSLELPTGNTNVSAGGIFSTVDPADPRFKQFAKGLKSRGDEGSGYVLKPNFKKPLDINDMPEDMLKTLQDIEMYRGRPSRGGAKKLDFDINNILRGSPMTGGKTPSGIDKEFADIFTGQGYDALRFPPRGMKGERSTMVSLDPSNLEIVDEIPYDQLDDFIRALLNDI